MEVNKIKDVSGFLKKKKGSKFLRIFGGTNLRWFEIHFETKTIGYKKKQAQKDFSKSYNFKQINDFIDSVTPEEAKSCDWQFGFSIKIKNKISILFTNTEEDFKMWSYAFNLILKRPEAFAPLKSKIFSRALEIFEKPYLEMVKKKKLQAKRNKIEKEAKLIKLEEEILTKDGVKIKKDEVKIKNDEVKIKKNEVKPKMDEMTIKINEERQKRIELYHKMEEEKSFNKIYNQEFQSIIEEFSENILDNYDSNNKTRNSNQLNSSFTSNNLAKINLKMKNNLEDWCVYDDLNQKVIFSEMSDANPINKYKRKLETEKAPKEIKELFKYEQSFENFQKPKEEVNFKPIRVGINQDKIKISDPIKSINSTNRDSIPRPNNQSIIGEISFIEGEKFKVQAKETPANNLNQSPSMFRRIPSKKKNEANSFMIQQESFADLMELTMIPNSSRNNRKGFEVMTNEVANENFRNSTKEVILDSDKIYLNTSFNNTFDNEGEGLKVKENILQKEKKSKDTTTNISNKSSFKDFLNFDDHLTILNNFATDEKIMNSKNERIPNILYKSSDAIKKFTAKPEIQNRNINLNEIKENNIDLTSNKTKNLSEKFDPNFSFESQNKTDSLNSSTLYNPLTMTGVFHKRNKSSFQKRSNSFSSNINKIMNSEEIMMNITNKIGLKIKAPEADGKEITSPILQIIKNPQLPPLYKKKKQPIPPNNINKKKIPSNLNKIQNNFANESSLLKKNNKSTNSVEITFNASKEKNIERQKTSEIDEEDWFSGRNNNSNNSASDIKTKYKVNIPSKNIKPDSLDSAKKPMNILSVFTHENSFLQSQNNEDSMISIDDDLSNSRLVIEQQKSLNKYREENRVKNLITIKDSARKNESFVKTNIDDKLKLLDNLEQEEDDELNQILHKHIIETNMTTLQEKEELNYSTTKEVDELRNYSKIMKNSNFISQIDFKPANDIISLSSLNTNHSSNMKNSIAPKNIQSSTTKRPEIASKNFIEKRLKDSKFLTYDEW